MSRRWYSCIRDIVNALNGGGGESVAMTSAPLIRGVLLPNAYQVLFTATETTVITAFSVTNTSGDVVNVTICLVADGDQPGAHNTALQIQMQPTSSDDAEEIQGQVLEAGDTIQGLASEANVIAIVASGQLASQ